MPSRKLVPLSFGISLSTEIVCDLIYCVKFDSTQSMTNWFIKYRISRAFVQVHLAHGARVANVTSILCFLRKISPINSNAIYRWNVRIRLNEWIDGVPEHTFDVINFSGFLLHESFCSAYVIVIACRVRARAVRQRRSVAKKEWNALILSVKHKLCARFFI